MGQDVAHLLDMIKQPPHILVLHVGGNDFGLLKGKDLILKACSDFEVIIQRWPGEKILWSNMLPRREW